MARVTAKIQISEARLEQRVGVIIRRKHRSLTRRIANQARADVPVDTGFLGRSIGELPQEYRPFHVDGGVEATADYAAPVHEGRQGRGRRIHVKHAQALHFFWHGREIFAKSVRMSSIRARPFLRNAGTRVVAADPDVELTHVILD